MTAPSILNVHTPVTSFAVLHSLHDDTLDTLFNTLSRKTNIGTAGARVGAGWLKYAWNDSIWNLDDGPSAKSWLRQRSTSCFLTHARTVYSRRLRNLRL
ncbi:hypothetical protein EXIGLDRAFT_774158 [Exidia glandulosa HHB12029]|uniref:Uncharacterized protein n=1 Tax=Exidia glandulosa HHB12029 TaxID=1314781 RepID=A0A165EHN4_EXIGL|nr:hypothetical protein EXIGLDRAFT_774158 [Exidia glandulosa HHB12029]